jgi:hypothetical protein
MSRIGRGEMVLTWSNGRKWKNEPSLVRLIAVVERGC